MDKDTQLNFVLQQGFRDVTPSQSKLQYPALMWQPRLIGGLVLVGVALQAWPLFLGLAAVLAWNATWPRFNVFDALYNALVASPPARPRLGPAPAPRRFAQGMAASFAVGIGVSLLRGLWVAAYVLEAVLLAALVALIFGGFCLGSYVFHLLKGDARFANRTLPWKRAA